MRPMALQALSMRQQPPFRYVDQILLLDLEGIMIRGSLLPALSSPRYGVSDCQLPTYLVVEALAQLSGVLMRETKQIGPSQIGYLVSVSNGSPMEDCYDIAQVLFQSRLLSRAGNIFQFECSVMCSFLEDVHFKLGIGVQDAS